MNNVKGFEDMEIWQLSRKLAHSVYQLTLKGSFAKDFGLLNQIRNSSGSVMDNIAEGFERDGNKEFIQFLSISKGSCGECKSQLYRAFDRDYITETELKKGLEEAKAIGRKIGNLMKYLKDSNMKGNKFK